MDCCGVQGVLRQVCGETMKKIGLKIALCILVLGLIFVGTDLLVIPHLPASWLWSSGDSDWQELAIPQLMKQIKVGMTPEEVSRLFGVTNAPPWPYMNGVAGARGFAVGAVKAIAPQVSLTV